MKKLKLSLDDLEVESFETTPEITDTKGTVMGYGVNGFEDTCPTECTCDTCVCPGTGGNSCGGTCVSTCVSTCGTCGGTCGNTCGNTCDGTCLATCFCPPGPSGDTCWAGCSISNPC